MLTSLRAGFFSYNHKFNIKNSNMPESRHTQLFSDPLRLMELFPECWVDFVQKHDPQFVAKLFNACKGLCAKASGGADVFPFPENLFKAFELCQPNDVKVWIQGQDPYPGHFKSKDGSQTPFAMGLSFSVHPDARVPVSLKNIFKELVDDVGVAYPPNGDLRKWSSQGVLMANAYLSVSPGQPGSHFDLPWPAVMESICRALSASKTMVFILWGAKAQALTQWIDPSHQHLVLCSSHPSPMGGSCKKFFGTKPFSKTNDFLAQNGFDTIDWQL